MAKFIDYLYLLISDKWAGIPWRGRGGIVP